MKKIILALVLVIMTLFAFSAIAAAEDVAAPAQKDIDVIVNGKTLEMDVAPIIVNDRTMVPMRAIFEALGANVTWIGGEDRLIIATQDDIVVIMQIDNENMIIDKASSDSEKKTVVLDAVPFILNDRTLVPARAVSEALEAEVEWNAETRTVTVTKNEGNVNSAGEN